MELANVAIGAFGAMQKLSELAALINLVDSGNPKRIMEIGFGKGGTAWAWSKIAGLEQLICVDMPGGSWGGQELHINKPVLDFIAGNCATKVDFISGNSQNSETLEAIEARLNGELLDFLFIDGDHSRLGVMADYDLYKKYVRPGGIIAFHDVCEHPPEFQCEVKLFWDKLKETLPSDSFTEFIDVNDQSWGGIAVMKIPEQVIPVAPAEAVVQ